MNMPCDRKLLQKLKTRESVSGTDSSGGFAYKLDFTVPAIATAIHAGHNVRSELLPFMNLSVSERMFEEDTATETMIEEMPNTVWGLESRAVYDLNRHPDIALPLTPKKFWGVRVYKSQPPVEVNRKSLANHDAFYRFLGTVITRILELFGYCIVYDIHSYNITRQKKKGIDNPPVFNLGTEALDRSRWEPEIESWLENLSSITLPGIKTTVAANLVFSGKGELCRRLCMWDRRILVLPTEVSKVYMNECSGELYPDILKAVRKGLCSAANSHINTLQAVKYPG